MIAPFFPPRRRVGSLRPYRFAKELPSQGWRPAVVALDAKGELGDRERLALAEVPVHRIALPWDRTQPASGRDVVEALQDSERGSRRDSERDFRKGSRRDSADAPQGRGVAAWIDRMMPLDTWWPVLIMGMPGIRRFAREFRPKAIWSTGDPWSSHWVALRLKASMDIPWIADFRDPWTLSSVPLRARSSFAASVDRRIERSVMDRADRIVFTCAAAADRYAAHYPASADRIRVIPNCAAEPALYALEMADGWFQDRGLGPGRRIEGLPPVGSNRQPSR